MEFTAVLGEHSSWKSTAVLINAVYRDESSQPFLIRKICRLTPKWRKGDFKSLIKGLK